jgi:hypothetical protein
VLRYDIRLGEADDCASVISIQRDWIERSFRGNEFDRGYMYGVPYEADQLQQLISRGALIVASSGSQIAGFALADNWTTNDTTQGYIGKVNELTGQGRFKGYARVCARTSAALEDKLHGTGAYRALMDRLRQMTSGEFDALMGTISKLSGKIQSHEGVGWATVAEDDCHKYVLIPTRS